MIRKKRILDIRNVYTANAFDLEGKMYIGAGSETKDEAYLYCLDDHSKSKIQGSPGGMMSIVPIPGRPELFVSVMGTFPSFHGEQAGVYLHERIAEDKWKTTKAFDLPFAHRCEILCCQDKKHLFVASVSRHKDEASDWSRPGELHYFSLSEISRTPWKSIVVPGELTRNHGMAIARIGGRERVCISGAEGIFYVDGEEVGDWSLVRILDKEVSEMAFLDMNSDGQQELVTIEPFHGDTLNIYVKKGNKWIRQYSSPLSFGHGLSCGHFNGKPVVVTGNRSGDLALEYHIIEDFDRGNIIRKIIEENAGPTQTQVFRHEGIDYIMSANQKMNEVSLYY